LVSDIPPGDGKIANLFFSVQELIRQRVELWRRVTLEQQMLSSEPWKMLHTTEIDTLE
jgi:hypothetical protein